MLSVFIFLLYFIINADIINRLVHIDKQISTIGTTHDFSFRIDEKGKDEISHLTKEFNNTMSKLEHLNNTLEDQVQQRTNKIKKLLKLKDEFIEQLGHDLKNPLGPMINLLPILEKKEKNPKKKQIFTVLSRNAGYMKSLVTKTIELAKVSSPNTQFQFESIDLLSEINDIIHTNTWLFDEKKIRLINNVPEGLSVFVDKLLFHQLITNIVNNAIKFTSSSGSITIDAKHNNHMVTLSVKDTDIGMTQQEIEQMFDEFYKADGSRHDFESSGLGLPIAKRIVEKHGGQIWAESEGLEKGSIISFTLPVDTDSISEYHVPNTIDISTEVDKFLMNNNL
jgi:signal transduction histidine kinase